MNLAEGEAAKLQALEMIEQAQTLLTQAAEVVSPVKGLGLVWEEVLETRSSVQRLWERLEEAPVPEDVDPRIPSNMTGFVEVVSALSLGETDSVLVHAVYSDPQETRDGTQVSYQVDPGADPIDELNRAVAEARSYLLVDEEHPMAIELD